MKISIVFILFFLNAAHADIVCRTKNAFSGDLTITIKKSSVIVESEGYKKKTFNNISDIWDGHMSGLITSTGLAIKYENQYGCITDVIILTDTRPGGRPGYIEAVKVALCEDSRRPYCNPN